MMYDKFGQIQEYICSDGCCIPDFGFFRIFKVAQKSSQRPCTIVQGISSKMSMREFSIFIIFSDTYTCTYVV